MNNQFKLESIMIAEVSLRKLERKAALTKTAKEKVILLNEIELLKSSIARAKLII